MGEIIPSEPRPRLVSLSCATGSGHRLRGATSSCRRLIVTASYRPSDCPPGVPPTTGECIVGGVSASLVHSATTQAQALDDGIHDAIRQVWMARGADREPTVQQWAEYDAEAKSFNATTSIFRPGFINGSTADPRDTLQERGPVPRALAGRAYRRAHRRVGPASTTAARHVLRRGRDRRTPSPA